MTNRNRMLTGVAALALAGIAAGAALAQNGATATATYWMSADTTSGMAGMMGAAGGGRRAMMSAMLGRGGMSGGAVKTLRLQLGSTGHAPGDPNAEHLVPAGLQVGASLPLVTPNAAPAAEEAPGQWPQNMEQPRGRILIYWGCGDHVRPGQPAVIDFATIQSGHIPPAFANLAAFRGETPPGPGRFATYGDWPNARNSTRVPEGGSLVGEHVVRGNYTPEIHFTLAPGQDFLAPVTLVQNAKSPIGSVPVVWQPVPGARAWFATAMGGGQNGDMVIWSSAESQAFAMAMDYLPDGEIARLVQQRVLMPGSADRCTVPTEVAAAGQQMIYGLTAFGGEANFSHPLRPARAPAGWHPDWTVKLRTKSTYMGLLGMDMAQMMGGRGDSAAGAPQPGPDQGDQGKKKKKGILGGIGGILGH